MGRTAKATTGRGQTNMDADERTQLLHDLEMKHQQNAGEAHILVKDEDIRRLRLRILLLRDENTSLRDQVELNMDTNTKLTAQCDDLGARIEAEMEVVRSQEQELRKQEREYKNLKAELQSMNNMTQDSTNLLSEKLSLSRELAVLKPEIEHLRSQVNHQQETLAEKLALERQVNTLEVELANEKKATRRAMQKRESNDRVEDELRKKLREMEKKLTAEKTERERLEDQLEQEKRTRQFALQEQDNTRELEADLRKKLQDVQKELRQEKEDKERIEEELQAATRASKKSQKVKVNTAEEDGLRAQLQQLQSDLEALQEENAKLRQDSQTAAVEADAHTEQLTKKLEKIKTKARETHEQLKQCQADLRKAQQQLSRSAGSDENTKTNAKSQAFRKRKAQEIAADDFTNIEIQTPGAEDTTKGRRAFKKRPFEPTLVGEKSAFSITPFLNRTRVMSDDAPDTDEGASNDYITGPQQVTEVVEATTTVPVDASADPVERDPAAAAPDEDEKPQPQPKTRGRPKKVLGEAPSAKKNALTKPATKKTVKAKGSLEKVAEEAPVENQENLPVAKVPAERTTTVKFNFTLPQDESTSSSLNGEPPKKKKRKVLGSTKTLFDEEEGEAPAARKPAPKVLLGGKRVVGKALAGVKRNAFAGTASFSPLKRDRRGVGASFLA
ncbi:Uu.00g100300.m01.CDS01 [Anthostomella pinea]|uniref:Uu.00g100300.m01.CDS01 n=1 Tax=Anthostomella pinea TaxID=933095 RepID=A0AAI8YFA6_9PEZI|nr:Uu.00g100300.m01.CDS01 [Anthostomella pinea]